MGSPKQEQKIAASGASTHESLKDELKISNAESSLAAWKVTFPKKEKKRGKKEKKNRTQQKRLPKNYETLSDIPKKDQKKPN
jgi:hypothetical protein